MNLPRNLRVGLVLTLVVVGVAVLAAFWTPYPPLTIDVLHRLAPPSATHWLGTDSFGRDVLSQLMAGAATSLFVALIAVAVGAGIGIPAGVLAAVGGGLVDTALMRLADLTFAFPALLTAVMITALRGPGAVNAMLAIGIFNIPVFARLARGAVLSLLRRDFVLAARAVGVPWRGIAWRHLLPNAAPILLVQATIQFALAVLADAALSYLGLGAQPPQPSWGRMLAESQSYVWTDPLLPVLPGLAIMVAVLGLNLLGDGLRDRLDPKLRRER
ncbi:MAG: ABC transporter permease [Rhodospirillales bacterium]|nr:ABC transporter permease [Rhodospirillales bacterium]